MGGGELNRYGHFLSDGRSIQMLDSVDGYTTLYIYILNVKMVNFVLCMCY